MSFNIESVVANLESDLKRKLEIGLDSAMEIVKEEAIKLSDERIYNTPLPSKYAKRTGLYRRSFKVNKIERYSRELENTTSYGVYVEYKHGYMIATDAVFNNKAKLIAEIEQHLK